MNIENRLALAHSAARAGRADEAQSWLVGLEDDGPWTDEVNSGIGMLHYMSGNALAAATALERVASPSYEALLTLSAAYTALGQRARAAEVQLSANSRRGEARSCAEDILDGADLENIQLPAMTRRNWGAAHAPARSGKI